MIMEVKIFHNLVKKNFNKKTEKNVYFKKLKNEKILLKNTFLHLF